MRLDTTAELKIKFKGEKQRYTVQAAGKRYLVCTKPFNAKKTVLYTIIDLKEEVRFMVELVTGTIFKTKEDCIENLEAFESGNVKHDDRKNVLPLDIEEVYARYR